ncbi:MAG: PaaX family transcriptional regulator C-terminal domain-containing protein [Leucobacter sp.]
MANGSSRTLLVTLLGAFARRTDDWMPISAIVELLGALEVDESSVRTGVSRLKKRRWFEAEKRDGRSGYRLTDEAKHALASGDRVIWHARQPAVLEEGWCIASFSVPEKERAKRHLLRSRLAMLGFGNIGSGMWIAPARMSVDARQLIDTLDLQEYTNIFCGQHEGGQDLIQLVQESWDLDAIHGEYRQFAEAHGDDVEQLIKRYGSGGIPLREAFVQYMRALDDWRVLPMRDPGLPRELLREDWAGDPAAELIGRVVSELDGPAFEFVREVVTA